MSLCSSSNLSDCYVGKMLIENPLEQNDRKISSVSFRQSWCIVIISTDRLIILPPYSLNMWTTSLDY